MADGNPHLRDYRLTAWAWRGAVNVRVHVSVVERACQDRHRGRAEAAAVNRAFVIATLPSRDAADDQPDDKQHRSNVHLDLRLRNAHTAKPPHGSYLGRHTRRSIPMRGVNALSRNLEVGSAAKFVGAYRRAARRTKTALRYVTRGGRGRGQGPG